MGKQFISKDFYDVWCLIDKMLPEQMGTIGDGLQRRYGRSGENAELTTNFLMFMCVAGILYRNGIMTMGQLSQTTSIPHATITRIVRRMVENGYAARFLDEQDKRITNTRLTDSGLELFLAAKEQLTEIAGMLLEGLPNMQRMAFMFLKIMNPPIASSRATLT